MSNRCTSNVTVGVDFDMGLETWCFGMFESLTLNETESCETESCCDVTCSSNSVGISRTNIVGGVTCATCVYSVRSGIGVLWCGGWIELKF